MDYWERLIETLLGHTNFNEYNGFDLILLGSGFIFWGMAYYHIIRNGFKYKFNEMPMIVAAGNIAWEFSWSFIFHGDLGRLFLWGCMIWFFMDLFINYQVLAYNRQRVANIWVKKNYYFIYLFYLIVWFLIVFYMAEDGDDNQLGVVSALLINVVMSSLYIYQLLSLPQFRNIGMDNKVAWWKMIGTGTITIASFFLWPKNGFLLSMGIASLLLDILYIYLFKVYQPNITVNESK
jgi:hypothetical protein